MTKKIAAFILAFVFCFGTAVIVGMFGDGQMHIHALDEGDPDQPSTTTDLIDHPTVIIRYSDGVEGPIYDFTNKTVTLKILIRNMDNVRCSEGSLTVKYDGNVFDFSSISGECFGFETWQTDIVILENKSGELTISVNRDPAEPYNVASEFTLTFSFARADIRTMEEHTKTFDLRLKFAGSKYSQDENIKTAKFTALLCPHNAADLEVKSFAATCQEYAHTDTICKICGTTVKTVVTGNVYSNHVYDYENIVRYIYASGYTACDPQRTHFIETEVKCQVCKTLVRVYDLEFHIGLDTSVKRYDASAGQYYYTCASGHRIVAKIQSAGTSTQTGTHEHTYGDPVVTKQPTCIEAGEQKRTCTVCNDVLIETIPAAGHKYGDPVVTKQPTCIEAGEKVRICSVCSNHDTPEAIPALGHDYGPGTVVTPATCTSTGTATHACTRCGAIENYTIPIDPDAHKFGEWVVSTVGTCQQREMRTRTCEYCGKTESQEFEYGPHDYTSEITVAPTCYEDGVKTYTCKHGDDTYTEVIKCTGHKFGAEVSDGKGTTTKTCTECGLVVSTTVTTKKTTKSVSHGPFTLTINNTELAQKDIQLRVTEIDRTAEEYMSHSIFLNALNAGLGKNYSIQDVYHVTLYIDGVESKMTSDMTLALALNSALEKSKTAIVYYAENGSSTMITNMSEASRKKLTVTMPGSALATAATDTIILAVEGSSVTPVTPSGNESTGQVTPPPPAQSSDNNVILPIVIIAVAVIAAGIVAVVVLKNSKKSGFDF